MTSLFFSESLILLHLISLSSAHLGPPVQEEVSNSNSSFVVEDAFIIARCRISILSVCRIENRTTSKTSLSLVNATCS